MDQRRYGSNNMTSPTTQLDVETTTWGRDSHELFDYETKVVAKKKFGVSRSQRVFRHGTDVVMEPDGAVYPIAADYLLSVRCHNGNYVVHPAERSVTTAGAESHLQPKKLWLIVKELNENRHMLQVGDTIKLGRFKLRVKQLVKSGEAVPEVRLDDAEPASSTLSQQEAEQMQCRICLTEGNGGERDPLICPCKCKGSIKYIHVECLKYWVNGRLNFQEDARISFFYKQLTCELCKSGFPSAVEINQERVLIVNIPKTEAPFIVLECIGNNNTHKGVHVMSMAEKKELKLGRGHESDVRIADVSISRCHAMIRFIRDNFVLEDNNSKFGTLVAVKRPVAVPRLNTEKLCVQVGRTVLHFSVSEANRAVEVKDDEVPVSTTESDKNSNGANPESRESQDGATSRYVQSNSGGGGGADVRLSNSQVTMEPQNSLQFPVNHYHSSMNFRAPLDHQQHCVQQHVGQSSVHSSSQVVMPTGSALVANQMVVSSPRLAGKGPSSSMNSASTTGGTVASRGVGGGGGGASHSNGQVSHQQAGSTGASGCLPLLALGPSRNCVVASDGSILYQQQQQQQHPSSPSGVCSNVGEPSLPSPLMYNSVALGSAGLSNSASSVSSQPHNQLGLVPYSASEWTTAPNSVRGGVPITGTAQHSQQTQQRVVAPAVPRLTAPIHSSHNAGGYTTSMSHSTSAPVGNINSPLGARGNVSSLSALNDNAHSVNCRSSAETRSAVPQSLSYRVGESAGSQRR